MQVSREAQRGEAPAVILSPDLWAGEESLSVQELGCGFALCRKS